MRFFHIDSTNAIECRIRTCWYGVWFIPRIVSVVLSLGVLVTVVTMVSPLTRRLLRQRCEPDLPNHGHWYFWERRLRRWRPPWRCTWRIITWKARRAYSARYPSIRSPFPNTSSIDIISSYSHPITCGNDSIKKRHNRDWILYYVSRDFISNAGKCVLRISATHSQSFGKKRWVYCKIKYHQKTFRPSYYQSYKVNYRTINRYSHILTRYPLDPHPSGKSIAPKWSFTTTATTTKKPRTWSLRFVIPTSNDCYGVMSVRFGAFVKSPNRSMYQPCEKWKRPLVPNLITYRKPITCMRYDRIWFGRGCANPRLLTTVIIRLCIPRQFVRYHIHIVNIVPNVYSSWKRYMVTSWWMSWNVMDHVGWNGPLEWNQWNDRNLPLPPRQQQQQQQYPAATMTFDDRRRRRRHHHHPNTTNASQPKSMNAIYPLWILRDVYKMQRIEFTIPLSDGSRGYGCPTNWHRNYHSTHPSWWMI